MIGKCYKCKNLFFCRVDTKLFFLGLVPRRCGCGALQPPANIRHPIEKIAKAVKSV